MTAEENRNNYEIGRVNSTDRDDPGTGNWEAKYSITNDPEGNFAIRTDPSTNQGVLRVVKVQCKDLLLKHCGKRVKGLDYKSFIVAGCI